MSLFNSVDIICPYCFEKFSVEQVLFADTRDLAQRDYPSLVSSRKYYFHENINLSNYPLIFEKRIETGSPFTAVTSLGDVTHTRVCPGCYNFLPGASGHFPTFVIPIFGSGKPMKSAFLSVLLHNINDRLSENFGATLIPADFETARTYYSEYEYPLYGMGEIPDPDEKPRALLYKFSRNNTSQLKTTINNKGAYLYNHALLMFYDINVSSLKAYTQYYSKVIAAASGTIFLIDSPKYEARDGNVFFTDPWLGLVAQLITALFGCCSSIPNAVVMTGISSCHGNTLKKWRKVTEKVRNITSITQGYPYNEMKNISDRIHLLLESDFRSASNLINSVFDMKETQMFAYDFHTDSVADITVDKVTEIAAEIPLLYLLSRFKLISDKKGKIIKK